VSCHIMQISRNSLPLCQHRTFPVDVLQRDQLGVLVA
jgi:hypothetical protein